MKKIPQDIIGDIAVLKFSRRTPWFWKKFLAWRFLKENKNVNVVLEKAVGFSGELRTQETRWLAGEKRKETIHKENGCKFKVHVDRAYFSPRLSSHRKEVCEEIVGEIVDDLGLGLQKPTSSSAKLKTHPSISEFSDKFGNPKTSVIKKEKSQKKIPKILVMFAGVAPWTIVLAKFLKNCGLKAEIYSNELNEGANELARGNVRLNKVSDYVKFIDGDAKDLPKKLSRKFGERKGFDFILMPRPNLEETFLGVALNLSRRGTEIYYHGFGTEEGVLSGVGVGAEYGNSERGNSKKNGTMAKKTKKGKVMIERMEKAGDIGKGRWRWLLKIVVN